jgi:hypothetical protein
MPEPKTKATKTSVKEFLSTIEPKEKRADALTLLKIFEQVTGEKGVMWGTGIIGFGKYHYKSTKSKQEGDWMLVGFSPRKQNLTLYIMHGNDASGALIKKLGKYKTSAGAMGGCLYINKLTDVDTKVLAQMIKKSYKTKRVYAV